jgi:hypothetical protein
VDFFLFLLVNFTLFLRPAEMVPALESVPLFYILILANMAVAAPKIVDQFRWNRLVTSPANLCVLGLLPMAVVSHLAQFDLWGARVTNTDYAKSIVYYIVLVAVVNSAERLRTFLYFIAIFAAATSAVAVLNYYELIEVPSLKILEYSEQFDSETGAPVMIRRILATGIFGDPNDLAAITVMGIVVCLFGMGDQRLGLFRPIWLVPLAVFFLALVLTKSRGGMLGFLVAMGTLAYFRLGLWKAALVGMVFVPGLLLIGGRQTEITVSGGTGNERVQYWYDGLMALKQNANFAVFGVGTFNYPEYADGHVAHNSFVQAFVEMGFIGGALFLGAFWFCGLELWKVGSFLRSRFHNLGNSPLMRLQPYLLAVLSGYVASQMSLTRTYVIPTYLVLGVGSVWGSESHRQGLPTLVRANGRQLFQLVLVSVAFLIGLQAFIRFSLH